MGPSIALVLLFAAASSCSAKLGGRFSKPERRLASPYYSTSDAAVLGALDPEAAIGNPLKGLLSSPRWTGDTPPSGMPSSLEFHYVGMDTVMTGDNKFDWTVLDTTITEAAKRNNHVIWRIYVDYPGRALALPKYLVDAGIKLVPRDNNEVSPHYDDPTLLLAFEQFIAAFGARYDGHKSVGFIQLGLLGKWGEWHTYPEKGLISADTEGKVARMYSAAFKTTQLQVRTQVPAAYESGIGLHDDSFGYSTLGPTGWFFWNEVIEAGMSAFWKKSAMGGETRPELQDTIFEDSYVPGSDKYKQNFTLCVEVTHATYMLTSKAFKNGGYTGTELANARRAHARMGYNFQVSNVAVSSTATSSSTVSVDVTVKQIGVAPFYYPLGLAFNCAGTTETLSGVDTLIELGETKVFSFASIPADSACLGNIRITLESPFAYAGKPIKFAQGNGSVVFSLPLPNGAAPTPTAPIPVPIVAPVPTPIVYPTLAPVRAATPAPYAAPTLAPRRAPTAAPVVRAPVPSDGILLESRTRSGPRFVISGSTESHTASGSIAAVGGYSGDLFRHHRWSRGTFSYIVTGFVPGTQHALTLGFAETYQPNCSIGKRVFNVVVNGSPLMANLDVFATAGCKTAYIPTYTVTADGMGKVEVKFEKGRENPFVSFLHFVPK